jgi:hypothetical protein
MVLFNTKGTNLTFWALRILMFDFELFVGERCKEGRYKKEGLKTLSSCQRLSLFL